MEKPKVVILSPLPLEAVRAMLGAEIDVEAVELEAYTGDSLEGLAEAVRGAQVIIGDFTFRLPMDASIARAAKGCQLVQQPSIGYQHIDLDAFREMGIPVANVGAANVIGVAEHTIMFILCLLKKALYFHGKTAQGDWSQSEIFTLGISELHGKVLGIVGMGHIGQEVAARARPFGCRMVYSDPMALDPQRERELGLERMGLEELLATSDIVTLHVPLNPQTRHLINGERISKMKSGAYLINTARGEVVDEAALAQALEDGHLAGAGIDVFSEEPLNPENPLLKSDKVMLSPHIAGGTNESRVRMVQVTAENVLRVLRGEKPRYVVNGVE